MSETTELLESPNAGAKKRGSGLSGMVLPELKALAGELGLKGTSTMKKADLIAAIAERQSGSSAAGRRTATPPASKSAAETSAVAEAKSGSAQRQEPQAEEPRRTVAAPESDGAEKAPARRRSATRAAGAARSIESDQPTLINVPESAPARTSVVESADTAPAAQTPAESSDPVDRSTDRRGESGDSNFGGSGATGSAEDGQGNRDRNNRRNRRNRRDRNDGFDPATTDAISAVLDAAQIGVTDHSATQGGANQNGAGQNGTIQNGSAQTGTAQNGTAQNGTAQNGTAQNGTAQGNRYNSQQRDGQQRDGQQRDGQQRDGARDNQRNQRNQQNRDQGRDQNRDQGRGQNDSQNDADEFDENGRRRGRRFRDRNRRGRERFAETPTDVEIRDDDVLLPVAGILDVLDSYAFVRTSGYLTGSNDVYVSLSQVRKNGLRRGDAVTGAVRAPREGEAARQKFNALVRLDTVNGLDPEAAKNRPEFTKLTPLYPNERLRLETESHILTTRVIDLVMPVGKGQRALIVSPPKAGKTSVLQAIANAIATNNPECHLMVVLVDERPEEVTDMQRSVKGEVIASTFDRPPSDHTQLAELAIERAKRLVEMGKDVVVLLDSITRLGRAYNLAAPASGRILSGGVDSTALFPPKRFLGAARNIENGGSLTIFASALVETGSAGDTVIFEEFKGTGNAELKLDRRIADKRVFPAIDIDQSSTRKEDLLLSPEELAIVLKLRRVLAALDSQQSLDLVLDRLRKTRSNIEFLMQVAQTTPGANSD